METCDPFTLDVTVKKIEYRTGMKGKIFLLAHLNPTKESKKKNFNALIFDDLDKRKVLSKGARIRVDFDKMMVPNIKTILKDSSIESELPRNCSSCDAKLDGSDKHLRCPNHYCPATSRGFLYQLITQASEFSNATVTPQFITLFLDHYVYNQTTNVVDNPKDFKLMFFSISEKNTQARENQWTKHNLTQGHSLWKLEVLIQKYLKSPRLPAKDFWSICNFPGTDAEQLELLSEISPKKLLNGSVNTESFLKLSNHIKSVLRDNLDFINFLNTFFEDFGEKEWETSKKSKLT